jgi:hypothetical protein
MHVPKPVLIVELLLMMPATAHLIVVTPMIPFALLLSNKAGSVSAFAALFAYFAGAYGIITVFKGFRTLWKGGALGESHVLGLLCGLVAACILIALQLMPPEVPYGSSTRRLNASNLFEYAAPIVVALHWLYLIKKGSGQLPNQSFKGTPNGAP